MTPGPAAAQDGERGLRAVTDVTGAITVSWRGDPARGCAEAGVCDVAGILHLRSDGRSVSFSSSSDPGDLASSLDIDLAPAVARVVRGPADAPAGVCVDTAGPTSLAVVDERRGARIRLTLSPANGDSAGEVAVAGRCAGPLPEDLAKVAFVTEIERRRLRSGEAVFDFSGRRPFAGGPFSGEVVSTLKVERSARVERDSTVSGGLVAGGTERDDDRLVRFELRYAVTATEGLLRTSFTGPPEPFCMVLDTCGLRGTHDISVEGPGQGSFVVYGYGRRSALRRPGLRGALQALRARRMRFSPRIFLPGLGGRVTATAARDGATPCTETHEVFALPELVARRRARGISLALGESSFSTPQLRTRCPGPTATDLGGPPIAGATILWGDLGAARLEVPLRAPAAPAGPFAVTQDGAVTIRLRRIRFEVTDPQ